MSGLCVKGCGSSYAVYRNDARVSNFYPSESRALDRMDCVKKAERLHDRNCMCCRTVFSSEGPHNRLCSPCRKQSVDPAMMSGSALLV